MHVDTELDDNTEENNYEPDLVNQSLSNKQETFVSVTSNRPSLIDGPSARRLKNSTKKLSKTDKKVAAIENKYLQKEVTYPSKTNFDKLFLFLSRINRLISNIDSAGV